MERTDAVIIGGGQAGLAMSRCLTERGVAHVVVERGRIGERWRSERWDSLRLLTPNWHSRLPHWHYTGTAPDDYMTMPEFIDYLEDYASSFAAPLREGTTVLAVERGEDGRYRVRTDRGDWDAANVVVATGFCDVPRVPGFANELTGELTQLVPTEYRNPAQLPPGGVLVVGASATGTQLAEELREAGRAVTLAVGTHVRLPRRYRGKDILWWMEMTGAFGAAADPGDERRSPPPQLIGRPDGRDLDLATLQASGVRLVGRATSGSGRVVTFADDLRETVAAAEANLGALLEKIDAFIDVMELADKAGPATPIAPVVLPDTIPTSLDLGAEGITSIVWATGYRRAYPWLKVPVLDEAGEIRQQGGITASPGLYVLGIRFMRRKSSNFIDGVGNDAQELSKHLADRMRERAA